MRIQLAYFYWWLKLQESHIEVSALYQLRGFFLPIHQRLDWDTKSWTKHVISNLISYFEVDISHSRYTFKQKYDFCALVFLLKCFVHRIFRFSFLVTFGSEVTKIWKFYIIFVYKARWARQKIEGKKITKLKWPKYQRPKD